MVLAVGSGPGPVEVTGGQEGGEPDKEGGREGWGVAGGQAAGSNHWLGGGSEITGSKRGHALRVQMCEGWSLRDK